MVDSNFNGFVKKVLEHSGIDLSKYKEDQMKRRLTSLFKKYGFSDFDNYYKGIIRNKILFDEFLDQVTINEFFRNPLRWNFLQKQILQKTDI